MNQSVNQDSPLKAAGRFSRLSYLAWNLVITIVTSIILVAAFAIFGSGFTPESASSYSIPTIIITVIIYIFIIYYTVVFVIRRLHDRNHSGWLSLILLVPIVNIFFAFYLLFAKGNAETNDFGAPRETLGWEKVFAWIYIILIILAIVAAVALPSLFSNLFNQDGGSLLEQGYSEQEYSEEEYSEAETELVTDTENSAETQATTE